MRSAASSLGVQLHIVHASTEPELDRAFTDLTQPRVDALVIGTDTFFNSQSAKLGELTRRHALPAVYQYREFTAAGGLGSYAGSIRDAYRVAGVYTGRILKGEKPANLPVQQSAKAELFVKSFDCQGSRREGASVGAGTRRRSAPVVVETRRSPSRRRDVAFTKNRDPYHRGCGCSSVTVIFGGTARWMNTSYTESAYRLGRIAWAA
jgi:hypothetical protein